MKIDLYPKHLTLESMTGELAVNGVFQCYFLTLPKGDGLPGSAIPPGLYSVVLAPSPKFQLIARTVPWFKIYMNVIPHITGIPNRSNILIHPGNSPHETEGCILVGNSLGQDYVGESRSAFAQLHPRIASAFADPLEGCSLEMRDIGNNHDAIQQAALGEN